MTQPISSPHARPAISQSVSPALETGTLPPYRVPAGDEYGIVGVAWGEPLIMCGRCFAVVPGWAAERHANFHRVWHRGSSLIDDGSRARDPRLPGQLQRPVVEEK